MKPPRVTLTEAAYIRVSDLRTIRHALSLLRDIVPDNNACIPDDEYHVVTRLLSKWQDASFPSIVCTEKES